MKLQGWVQEGKRRELSGKHNTALLAHSQTVLLVMQRRVSGVQLAKGVLSPPAHIVTCSHRFCMHPHSYA
jgi:hypothetical protein